MLYSRQLQSQLLYGTFKRLTNCWVPNLQVSKWNMGKQKTLQRWSSYVWLHQKGLQLGQPKETSDTVQQILHQMFNTMTGHKSSTPTNSIHSTEWSYGLSTVEKVQSVNDGYGHLWHNHAHVSTFQKCNYTQPDGKSKQLAGVWKTVDKRTCHLDKGYIISYFRWFLLVY